jgi:hypothetical protein
VRPCKGQLIESFHHKEIHMNTQSPQLAQARRRAGRQLGFYIHAAVFVAVNVLLVAINLGVTPTRPWSLFPLLGWGIGLLAHALAALGPFGRLYQALVAREFARLPAAGAEQR